MDWVLFSAIALVVIVLFSGFVGGALPALYTGLLGVLTLHFQGWNNQHLFWCLVVTFVIALVFYLARYSGRVVTTDRGTTVAT